MALFDRRRFRILEQEDVYFKIRLEVNLGIIFGDWYFVDSFPNREQAERVQKRLEEDIRCL